MLLFVFVCKRFRKVLQRRTLPDTDGLLAPSSMFRLVPLCKNPDHKPAVEPCVTNHMRVEPVNTQFKRTWKVLFGINNNDEIDRSQIRPPGGDWSCLASLFRGSHHPFPFFSQPPYECIFFPKKRQNTPTKVKESSDGCNPRRIITVKPLGPQILQPQAQLFTQKMRNVPPAHPLRKNTKNSSETISTISTISQKHFASHYPGFSTWCVAAHGVGLG